MSVTKTPFFSLAAKGSIADTLTAQKRDSKTLIRSKPLPAYRKTLPQMYQRWLYQDYAYLWTKQSQATKDGYRSLGASHHMTAFQEWMKEMLLTTPDIVGCWRLDERSGVIAYDRGIYPNNGTITGATPAPCAIDYGLYFTINDRVSCGACSNWPVFDDFTLELFYNYTQMNWYRGIVDKLNSFSLFNYLDTAYRVDFRLYDSVGTEFRWVSWAGISLAGLHHLLLSCPKGAANHTYVDGVDRPSWEGGIRNLPVRVTATPLYFGYSAGKNEWLTGYLDHIVIYNRALDQVEALRHAERRYP